MNPLLGPDAPVATGNPPSAEGRRRQNLYRRAEIGASGTIVRMAWGPDSDQTFASAYPGVTIHVGHHRSGTSLTPGSFFGQFDVDGFVKVVNEASYVVPQRTDVSGGGTAFDGYLNWPRLEAFFEFNGQDDVLVDVAAREGNTYQRFRTFRAYDQLVGAPACTCLALAGCRPNNSIGLRQMDTTYLGDAPNPPPVPLQVFNPAPFVDVMQFELAKLRSDARSLYYDTGTADPDYRTPIVNPVVQPGGAQLVLAWSASADGIVEDVPFSADIHACDGFRHIRFHAVLRTNIFTLERARVSLLAVPFTFE
jgi:hypothetical protein